MTMDCLNRLLKTQGSKEANNDRGNVDEKVPPRVWRSMWWMNVEH
ncbi:hypothetical protein ACPOL_7031 (plasmid) [Acidisarcina polymorpha]|uniref:Uncharacterized protein n=1 Tax=Acidisarcina polymorpha TaxID=2211140 RepID=A0A2Z5GAT7_9BACT|nr:hypothetical protein ACPOL_7031 [Acidisarcina polymorpha]